MSDVPIPEGLIGRPGLVAMLQRVSPDGNGRLVAVRHPVGPMRSLSRSPKPVFAWQVLVLGEPVNVNGKPTREIVVGDPCLKPVSQLSPEEVDKLKLSQAHEDFDAAMADLVRILEKNPMTDEQLDAAVTEAANVFGIGYALEVVPVATALRDMGFRPSQPNSDTVLHWSGIYQGRELYVMAGPDMFGNWTITGTSSTQREKMWAEKVVLGNESRGKLAKLVIDLWREAFGKNAQPPSNLEFGLLYEQHQEDVRSLDIGLPRLYLDGEVFRAIRTWLARRCPHVSQDERAGSDLRLSLSFDDGLLRFSAGGELFACPGWGVWVGDCEVSLAALIDTPPANLRGRNMVLERQLEEISINGHALALLRAEAEAT